MSAIFDFSSLITVFVLSICTTTYLRELRPAIFDASISSDNKRNGGVEPNDTTAGTTTPNTTEGTFQNDTNPNRQRLQAHHHRDGMMGFLWKLSRVGERCSPYISVACILQALNILFWK
jgi:hypothetical protein